MPTKNYKSSSKGSRVIQWTQHLGIQYQKKIVWSLKCACRTAFSLLREREKKNMIIKFLWGANWMEGSDVATTFSSKIGFP